MTKTAAPDMYQQVTDKIVALLESGGAGGGIDWARRASGIPRNFGTRAAYNGINVLLLWATAQELGYKHNYWLTYKQATDMGGQVRKGEKGTLCAFYKMIERTSKNGDGDDSEQVPVISPFWLFNLDQIDGLAVPSGEIAWSEYAQIEAAENVLAKSGAVIHEGGTKASYSPSRDVISVPDRTQFKSVTDFYSVALHELTHWTGAKTRLAREFDTRFGSEAYAFEELVAEIGSAFLNAELGIIATSLPNHACYLASWLKVLRNDKRAIFTAASQASKAHRFILDLVNGPAITQQAA